MRIGLKFCGGCNPGFDRSSVANLIAEGLKGKAKLVPPEERALDAVIAIEGCPTACADLDPFSELPIYRITSLEEGERFLSRVGKDLFP